MLGQTKFGVKNTPNLVKKLIGKNKHYFNVNCNNNIFYNLNNLYNISCKVKGPRINFGGDHSMAISTVAYSLNQNKNTKVIWIDAHADINTFKSSYTKNIHGMPVSFLTGLDTNTNFSFIKNLLPLENILYIGVRDMDDFEKETLHNNNINIIQVKDIRSNFSESINYINDFVGDDPIHISFDVDSIDPKLIHSTGTPVSNGLNVKEAKNIINTLYKRNLVNIDVTELNLNIGKLTYNKI